jgi:DNA-directed RNA polymerase specialized sigma24 family protein
LVAGSDAGWFINWSSSSFGHGTETGLSEEQLLDRFVTARDESAFEALVERYGPMVLGVCRQFLRDPNDVENAFQTTFLMLVRKAGSLRQRDLLGNWLYGVACRVALRSRTLGIRRQMRPRANHPHPQRIAVIKKLEEPVTLHFPMETPLMETPWKRS